MTHPHNFRLDTSCFFCLRVAIASPMKTSNQSLISQLTISETWAVWRRSHDEISADKTIVPPPALSLSLSSAPTFLVSERKPCPNAKLHNANCRPDWAGHPRHSGPRSQRKKYKASRASGADVYGSGRATRLTISHLGPGPAAWERGVGDKVALNNLKLRATSARHSRRPLHAKTKPFLCASWQQRRGALPRGKNTSSRRSASDHGTSC